MSNFSSFSYFHTFLSLGVKQGLQEIPKFDINDLRLLFHCGILIPRKCPRKTHFNTQCTANVCRDLQGLCRGFLQYLQGKSCNIYRFSLQFLQFVNIAGKTCKYYRIFPADIAEYPCRVPVNPCKHLHFTFL